MMRPSKLTYLLTCFGLITLQIIMISTQASAATEMSSAATSATNADTTQASVTITDRTQTSATDTGTTQASATDTGTTSASATNAGTTQASATNTGTTSASVTNTGTPQASATNTGTTQASATNTGTTQASAGGATTTAPATAAPTTTAPATAAPTTTAYERTVQSCSVVLNEPYTSDLANPTSEAYKAKSKKFEKDMSSSIRNSTGDPKAEVKVTGYRRSSVIVDFNLILSRVVSQDAILNATKTALKASGYNFTESSITVSKPIKSTYKPVPQHPDKKARRTDVVYRVVLNNEQYMAEYNNAKSKPYTDKVAELTRKITIGYSLITTVQLIALRIESLFNGSLGVNFHASIARPASSMSLEQLKVLVVVALSAGGLDVKSAAVLSFVDNQDTTTKESGISPGATAFFVVFALIFVACIIIVLVFLRRWRYDQKDRMVQLRAINYH